MLVPLFITASLAFQAQVSVRPSDSLDIMGKMAVSETHDGAIQRAADKQFNSWLERNFQMKFNGMAKALEDFGRSWNQSHKLNPGDMHKLDKAWHELEKAEPWFNTSADR